jgi:hypothetical protein
MSGWVDRVMLSVCSEALGPSTLCGARSGSVARATVCSMAPLKPFFRGARLVLVLQSGLALLETHLFGFA